MKNISDILDRTLGYLSRTKKYLPVAFVVLVVALYGFLVYRASVLNSAEPSSATASTQPAPTNVPHIDPKVLSQLQNLQDNSVSVQSLFDQNRDNPFQE